MMYYHHGFGITGFFTSLIMIIMMALPLILLVWLSFYLYDKRSSRTTLTKSSPEIKLARGEISIAEYRRLKNK